MYTEERILENFKIDNIGIEKEFNFSFSDELLKPEGTCVYKDASRIIFLNGKQELQYIGAMEQGVSGAFLCIETIGNKAVIKVKKNAKQKRITTKTILDAIDVVRIAVEKKGVILHASYIIWNEKAILFTAPSGIGKSTQAELWKTLKGAKIINGDRVIIRKDNDDCEAWGLPYAGSSKYCENVKSTLDAIVYLSQAEHTQIERISGSKAFRKVWEGCSVPMWNEKDVSKVSDLVYEIIMEVPVFHLTCTPDESAVIALEDALKNI